MCEFCTEHGEGKQWYLQMKNYACELLYEDLTAQQQDITGAKNRMEWNHNFIREFTLPATGRVALPGQPESPGTSPAAPPPLLSEAEIVSHSMVEHFGQVIPIEDVERILEHVDSITRIPCGCRYLSTGLTNQRYCFGLGLDRFGILGEYPDAAASLEVLQPQEALKLMQAFDREGLMHSVWTGVTPYVIGICNCDRDCGAYKGYIEMRGAPNFFRAEYVCTADWDLCNGCKECMSQCQFGAQFYSSALEKVYIDPTRCFGCGVCRAACPNNAIALIPRENVPAAAGLWLKS